MTTVQITLPDDLAQKASAAGLFSPAAMAAMLRERLRRDAQEGLREIWQRLPREELTPRIEQEIVDIVRADRIACRRQGER